MPFGWQAYLRITFRLVLSRLITGSRQLRLRFSMGTRQHHSAPCTSINTSDHRSFLIVDNYLTSYNPPPSPVPPIHNKNPPEMIEEPSRSPQHSPGADAGQGLWQACVEQLAQDLPEQQFNTWIKPLIAQVAEDFSKVTVLVGNRFKLDWIRAQYAGRIARRPVWPARHPGVSARSAGIRCTHLRTTRSV